jgi:hypothetical protein
MNALKFVVRLPIYAVLLAVWPLVKTMDWAFTKPGSSISMPGFREYISESFND